MENDKKEIFKKVLKVLSQLDNEYIIKMQALLGDDWNDKKIFNFEFKLSVIKDEYLYIMSKE